MLILRQREPTRRKLEALALSGDDDDVAGESSVSKRSRSEDEDPAWSPENESQSAVAAAHGAHGGAGNDWAQYPSWLDAAEMLPIALRNKTFEDLCDSFKEPDAGKPFDMESKAVPYLREMDMTPTSLPPPRSRAVDDGSAIEFSTEVQSKRISATRYSPLLKLAVDDGRILHCECGCVGGKTRRGHAGALLMGLWREASQENALYYMQHFAPLRTQAGRRTLSDVAAAILVPDPSASLEGALERVRLSDDEAAAEPHSSSAAAASSSSIGVALSPPPPAAVAPVRARDESDDTEVKYTA